MTNEPVFVGVGELPAGKFPDRTFMDAITDVAHLALEDGGLALDDVDVLLLAPALASDDDNADLIFSRVPEELGITGRLKTNMEVHSGGSTSDNLARVAASLIRAGEAETVLVLQADRPGSADVGEWIDKLSRNGIPREWEAPAGLGYNAIGALITQRYMFESGASAADMASICVALREWSHLNPNAFHRGKELTVEKVLSSRMVADPLHSLECPLMADGATSFVMTTADKARTLGVPGVRIVGDGGCVTHFSIAQEPDLARLGWEKASSAAFERAGWTVDDIQLAEVYDSYPAVLAIALEGIGVAPRGEAARMFADKQFSPGGRLPVNTNGGLLSAGHTAIGGGLALLVEAARQLLWKAPAGRQIADVRRAVVGGTGGSYSDAQVMLFERFEGGAR